MKQLTLISLINNKPRQFQNLINELWGIIQNSKIKDIFEPYSIEQIHGTLIGMERLAEADKFYNANLWNDLNIKIEMSFTNLNEILNNYLPMDIRFGGFSEDYNDFLSLNQQPFQRSFQINWETRKVLMIGWPHSNGNFQNQKLLNLRNEFEERCNIRHKYSKYLDNDYFVVIGSIKDIDLCGEKKLAAYKNEALNLENKVHEYLSLNPIHITITSNDVSLARYDNDSLPRETTELYPLNNWDETFVKQLFQPLS